MNQTLCMIGLGYIGLPSSVVFADSGYDVVGVDINQTVIKQINDKQVDTQESRVAERVTDLVTKDKLRASLKPVSADIFVIAVPTPHNADSTANLDYLISALRSLIPFLNKGNTVIVESTIPPRTLRDVIVPIVEESGLIAGEDFYLAYCPERVMPGNIMAELYASNRLIGGINEASAKQAASVYEGIIEGKVIQTTAESAEMAKLMENTYRSVNIALANELSKMSEGLDINPLEVINLANEHPRVNIHQPGPGVGGHCVAVDPYFIMEKAPEHSSLIRSALAINESMPAFIVDQINRIPAVKKVGVFGVAYKGETNDVRNSPAIEVIHLLQAKGYEVACHDPYIKQEQVSFPLYSKEDVLEGADLALILTDHKPFRTPDGKQMQRQMDKPLLLDTRNCVTEIPDGIEYYNFANLYELKKTKPLLKIDR